MEQGIINMLLGRLLYEGATSYAFTIVNFVSSKGRNIKIIYREAIMQKVLTLFITLLLAYYL